VTPIGGQGFILGRGNQQISPAVIRAVLARGGRAAIVVVATPAKLAALGTRPLLVDTGDAELDRELAGHVQVITGHRDRAVARVAAA
jgi:predicted polyphosphate/ATP-dependent NAD kinase